uniref:Putative secreted protein n=1 Tax=Anopheles triannulatus TaxID=58253 RepID=A0A2M4B669_9DIPT
MFSLMCFLVSISCLYEATIASKALAIRFMFHVVPTISFSSNTWANNFKRARLFSAFDKTSARMVTKIASLLQ